MTALPKLTELEQDVLDGCYRSEYNDGGNHFDIWSWSIAARKTGIKQVSGVVSSLVKKGLVTCGGTGTKDDDNTVAVTPLGIEVARSLGFFEVRESDGMELYNPDHTDSFRPALNKKVEGPSAAEINEAVGKLVKELKAKAPAIKKVLASEWPVLGKGKEGNKLSVRVGRGIEQVMQLDDAGVLREFGLEVVGQTKDSITLAATRKDLGNFRNACADRISSQYDQPLWYMSSAKATVTKIDAALGGK